jgi:hypothetical protein
MPRIMVGLLAAVGVAMSALVGLGHGALVWLAITCASATTGLGAYLAIVPIKKNGQITYTNAGKTLAFIRFWPKGHPLHAYAQVRGDMNVTAPSFR